MTWAGVVTVDWVVVRVVPVVDSLGFSGVRGCGRSCWPLIGWPRVLLAAVVGVDGADYVRVRACSRVWAGLLAVV